MISMDDNDFFVASDFQTHIQSKNMARAILKLVLIIRVTLLCSPLESSEFCNSSRVPLSSGSGNLCL